MKKLSLFLSAVLLTASVAIVSCTKDESPEPVFTESVVTKSMFPFMSNAHKAKLNKANARTSATNDVVVHGPFTVTVNAVKLPGSSGTGNFWRLLLLGWPNYNAVDYLCDVYEYKYTLTIPTNAAFAFQGATNLGWPANMNPVNWSTPPAATYNFNSTTGVVNMVTYTVVPRYQLNGSQPNPNQIKYPSNFTSTSFTYQYVTF